MLGRYSRKGQVAIFIIIAIVLVAGVVGYFMLRDRIGVDGIPKNIEPLYNSFLSCLESDTLVGINILESQAGYIELPDFEAGSEYMPFSNHLNFLGNPIPYWYYVSGNNIQKEQLPSKSFMEDELGNFIEREIRDCIFDEYYEQGFEIDLGEPEAEVIINDNIVEIDLNMDLSVSTGEDSVLAREHNIQVNSELGTLYKNARKIYDEEQDSLFLEEYAVDTLRLYAPVDGVELNCGAETWSADEIFDNLEEAIEVNTLALKTLGGDFDLKNKEHEYFVIDLGLDSGVNARFLNSRDWSNMFEVEPDEGSVLVAKPIGNQPGLGAMGFCYVPYHFVYNMRYPVLVQVYSEDVGETFQFPVAIVIQGNKPREALDVSASAISNSEMCEYMNTKVQVKTYDSSLNPVEADISYKCFNEICSIGKTSLTGLNGEFPQCVNGFIVAKAEGFADSNYLYSTINEGSAEIILDRLYELDVDLKLDGASFSGKNGNAIISFISDDSSKTIVYPEQKTIELSEAQYEVQVYVYKNSTLKLEGTTKEQCMEIPKSGLGGILGLTEEKCFDINIPEQIISNALSGGGKQNYYVLENELQGSDSIEINAQTLPIPNSIEQLQDNYLLFEDKGLAISFD